MKRLKGPELKMPDLKAPQFLADIYYDLRDRRLLPVVALVVVATAAVPFLLGDSEEAPPPMAAQEAAESARLEIEDNSGLTVVEAKPGLRDYRKRLRARTPTDPFEQRYTGLPEGVQLESSEVSSVTDTSDAGSGEVSIDDVEQSIPGIEDEPGSAPAGSGDGAGGESDERPRLFEFVIDVQISHSETTADGGTEMGKPEIRHKVRPLTPLPGKKTQVLTLMGVNLRNGKVMFMVADGARPVFGDFACVARTDTCELLEIEPGMLLEVERELNGVRYRFKVTGIDAVWAGKVGDSRSSRGTLEGSYVRGGLWAP